MIANSPSKFKFICNICIKLAYSFNTFYRKKMKMFGCMKDFNYFCNVIKPYSEIKDKKMKL